MARDFDEENILDKMRSLRDKRDLEILKEQLGTTNIDTDYQKEFPKDKVLNVKCLGKIKWKEKIGGKMVDSEKDIYLVIEQKEKDGKLVQVERYCTEDGEVLGGNNKSDRYNFIMLSEKYKERQEILESLQSLSKEGNLDLSKVENERLEEIAKALGVKVEDLGKLSEIEADEEIDKERDEKQKDIEQKKDKRDKDREEDQKDREEYQKDRDKEKEADRDNNEDEKGDGKEDNDKDDKEKEILSKNEVEKISSKTEIDVEQKVTDKETMSSLLKVQDKGYKKIAVVYSDKLQEGGNSTRFSIVGIKEDGSAEKIDTLEQRYGSSPTKKINSLNRDGSEIEEKQVQSIYQIKGENEKQVAVNIGNMGTIEASLVRTPRQDNGEAISIPIETNTVRPTTRETRELMNQQRNPSVKEEVERIEEHKEAGCEEVTIKDINDNPNDDTHTHAEDVDYAKLATKWGFYDINGKPNQEKAKEVLEKAMQENKGKSQDEVINLVTEEFEEDFMGDGNRL